VLATILDVVVRDRDHADEEVQSAIFPAKDAN
jgi:hypothetical protein